MERAKVVRRLRIAWTAFFGVLCVLLVVLWVRSYWVSDIINVPRNQKRAMFVVSNMGLLQFGDANREGSSFGLGWSSFPPSAEMRTFTVLGFAYKTFPEVSYVDFPNWFAILIAIVLAAIPWLHGRFSLRTLLIATTLIAVVLGLAVWSSA